MREKPIRLTPAQRSKCNRLLKRLCTNYDDGNCLLLDDGEPCVCPQSICYSVLCRYFRNAVLPAESSLYAELFRFESKRCSRCGKPFLPKSNRQKYCENCGRLVHRMQKTESERRRRSVDG